MRAVLIDHYGGSEVVRIGELPPSEPGAGQLLVRVEAAGVNPVDWKVRAGLMQGAFERSTSPIPGSEGARRGIHNEFSKALFPLVLGAEVAGTVLSVGEGVSGFAVGDAVHGMLGVSGAFADWVVVDAAKLAKKPDSISMAAAAALPVAALTAIAALDAGFVGKGTRLLIHAAAGGVGCLAVQLAVIRGAEVTALGSPGNIEFLRRLGATHVVDRTSAYEDTLHAFDVVLDAHGAEATARSWKLLRKGGSLICLADPPDPAVAEAHGVRAAKVFAAAKGELLAPVDLLAEQGSVKIHIARTYPFEHVREALKEVESGQTQGKIVLTFH